MKIFAFTGFLGSLDDWDFLKPFLGEWALSPQVVEPSLSEESSLGQGSWDETCERFVDDHIKLGLDSDQKSFLLGYSLGGRMAANLCVRYPEYFCGLLAISAHPGLSSEEERAQRREQDLVWAKRFHSAEENWETLMKDWNSQGVFGGSENQILRMDSAALRKRSWLQLSHLSLGHQADLAPRLSSCSVPQLWATGAGDLKFTGLAETLSHGSGGRIRHVVVPDHGHRWPWTLASHEAGELISNLILRTTLRGANT